MSLSFTPIQASALPALQALWNAQLAPHPADSLAQELQDGARAQGRQSVIAWRAGVPVGCAGWVTLGVANDGCAYGSPLVAADADAAFGLTGYIREQVAGHGADRLRITVRAGERAKADALRVAGFVPLFEFVNFNHPLPIKGPLGLPAGLHSVSPSLIDWNALLALDLLTFSGVPNAPPPDIGGLQDEWAAADPEASRVLADASGRYQAFIRVIGNAVEAVGVHPDWRGRGVAATLYRIAAAALLARGARCMTALVAASNAGSMALHQNLKFTEGAPRWTVYEAAL